MRKIKESRINLVSEQLVLISEMEKNGEQRLGEVVGVQSSSLGI